MTETKIESAEEFAKLLVDHYYMAERGHSLTRDGIRNQRMATIQKIESRDAAIRSEAERAAKVALLEELEARTAELNQERNTQRFQCVSEAYSELQTKYAPTTEPPSPYDAPCACDERQLVECGHATDSAGHCINCGKMRATTKGKSHGS